MPNWCENVVRVHADTAEELEMFTSHVASEDNPFSFTGHAFSVELRGGEVSFEIDDTVAEYNFDTAWGPPEEFYNHFVKTFPYHQINWYYHEPNTLMAGYLGEKSTND
jgi:hypothetical protein|tara:strand:- start:529 stop:852 length:324 start_codon:yes stop_codon:yes gene_type:complete